MGNACLNPSANVQNTNEEKGKLQPKKILSPNETNVGNHENVGLNFVTKIQNDNLEISPEIKRMLTKQDHDHVADTDKEMKDEEQLHVTKNNIKKQNMEHLIPNRPHIEGKTVELVPEPKKVEVARKIEWKTVKSNRLEIQSSFYSGVGNYPSFNSPKFGRNKQKLIIYNSQTTPTSLEFSISQDEHQYRDRASIGFYLFYVGNEAPVNLEEHKYNRREQILRMSGTFNKILKKISLKSKGYYVLILVSYTTKVPDSKSYKMSISSEEKYQMEFLFEERNFRVFKEDDLSIVKEFQGKWDLHNSANYGSVDFFQKCPKFSFKLYDKNTRMKIKLKKEKSQFQTKIGILVTDDTVKKNEIAFFGKHTCTGNKDLEIRFDLEGRYLDRILIFPFIYPKGSENSFTLKIESNHEFFQEQEKEEKCYKETFSGQLKKNFNFSDVNCLNFTKNENFTLNIREKSVLYCKIFQKGDIKKQKYLKLFVINCETNEVVYETQNKFRHFNVTSEITLPKGLFNLYICTFKNRNEVTIDYDFQISSRNMVEVSKCSIETKELETIFKTEGVYKFLYTEEQSVGLQNQYALQLENEEFLEVSLSRLEKKFAKFMFHIYCVPEKKRIESNINGKVVFSSHSSTHDEVTSLLCLPSGTYILIPFVEFGIGGHYSLVIKSAAGTKVEEIKEKCIHEKQAVFGFLTPQVSCDKADFDLLQYVEFTPKKSSSDSVQYFLSTVPGVHERLVFDVPDMKGGREKQVSEKKMNYRVQIYKEDKTTVFYDSKKYYMFPEVKRINFEAGSSYFIICMSKNEALLKCSMKTTGGEFGWRIHNEVKFFEMVSGNVHKSELEIIFHQKGCLDKNDEDFGNNKKISVDTTYLKEDLNVCFTLSKISNGVQPYGIVVNKKKERFEEFTRKTKTGFCKEMVIKLCFQKGHVFEVIFMSEEMNGKFKLTIEKSLNLDMPMNRVEEREFKTVEFVDNEFFSSFDCGGAGFDSESFMNNNRFVVENCGKKCRMYISVQQSTIQNYKVVEDGKNEKILDIIKKEVGMLDTFQKDSCTGTFVTFGIYVFKSNNEKCEFMELIKTTNFKCVKKFGLNVELEKGKYVVVVSNKTKKKRNQYDISFVYQNKNMIKVIPIIKQVKHRVEELTKEIIFESAWEGSLTGGFESQEDNPKYSIIAKKETRVLFSLKKRFKKLGIIGMILRKGKKVIGTYKNKNMFQRDVNLINYVLPSGIFEVIIIGTETLEGKFEFKVKSDLDLEVKRLNSSSFDCLEFVDAFVPGIVENIKYVISKKKELGHRREQLVIHMESLDNAKSMRFLVRNKENENIFTPKKWLNLKGCTIMHKIFVEDKECVVVPEILKKSFGKYRIKFYVNKDFLDVKKITSSSLICVDRTPPKDDNFTKYGYIFKGVFNVPNHSVMFSVRSKNTECKLTLHCDNNKMLKKGFRILEKETRKEILRTTASYFVPKISVNVVFTEPGKFEVETFLEELKNRDVSENKERLFFTLSNKSIEIVDVKSMTKCEKVSLVASTEPDDTLESELQKQLLKGVEKLPDFNPSTNKRSHSGILCVCGELVDAIMTGVPDTYIECSCNVRKREVQRLMGMGRTEELPIPFYEPIIAGGKFGKGRIVVIAETRFFLETNFLNKSYDMKRLFENFMDYLGPDPNASYIKILVFQKHGDDLFETKLETLELHKKVIVTIVNDFPKFVELAMGGKYGMTIAFMTTNPSYHMHSEKCLLEYRSYLQRGGSGIILGNFRKAMSFYNTGQKSYKTYSGNIILRGSGIVFADGYVRQNSFDDLEKNFYWLDKSDKEKYIKMGILHEEKDANECGAYLKKYSCHTKCNVISVMKKVRWIFERAKKMPCKSVIYPYLNILYSACWNLDPLANFNVLKDFFDDNCFIREEEPIVFKQFFKRMIVAANSSHWAHLDEEKIPKNTIQAAMFPGPVSVSAPRVDKEIICDKYNFWISTKLYAAPGDVITVCVPEECCSDDLRLVIGVHSDNFWWERDKSMKRYPDVLVTKLLNQPTVKVGSVFGGIISIEVTEKFFKKTLKNKNIVIKGAVESAFYEKGKTTEEQWITNEISKPAPWCEVRGDMISFYLPLDIVASCPDVEEFIQFWDEFCGYLCELSGGPFRSLNRIVIDQFKPEGSAAVAHSGYPIVFVWCCWKLFMRWGLVKSNGKDGAMGHELGHNMHGQFEYVWKGRADPMATTYSYYCKWKMIGVRVDESLFYVRNYERAILHMKNSGFSQKEKLLYYKSDSYVLSTMMDLILVSQFGWEPFKKLFRMYHQFEIWKLEDKKGLSLKTDEQKIDLWVELFCFEVERNICDYYLLWGLPVSEDVQKKCSKFKRWLPF